MCHNHDDCGMKPAKPHSCFNCIHFEVCARNKTLGEIALGFWANLDSPGTTGIHRELAAIIGGYCAQWQPRQARQLP